EEGSECECEWLVVKVNTTVTGLDPKGGQMDGEEWNMPCMQCPPLVEVEVLIGSGTPTLIARGVPAVLKSRGSIGGVA
ncbi:hypothetical protein OFB79_26750, partial [Escherichia coli]|nr:hypothetical protein [Escherichia coli]